MGTLTRYTKIKSNYADYRRIILTYRIIVQSLGVMYYTKHMKLSGSILPNY